MARELSFEILKQPHVRHAYSFSGNSGPNFYYNLVEKPRSPNLSRIDVELDGDEFDGTFVSDWEFVKGKGDLDECNGIYLNGTYMYIITDTYPYVGRCLMGEFEEERHPGPPPGREGRGQRPPRN